MIAERTHRGQHGEDCFGCKVRSIQFSPACTPTRRNNVPPPPPQNQWEKGVATDSRGMPYLDEKLNPIGLQHLADNRSKIEGQIRDLTNSRNNPVKEK